MALWVRDTALKLRQAGIELTKRALDHAKSTAVYKTSHENNSWKMDVKGKDEDLNWLL
jgi:hypothetical protein